MQEEIEKLKEKLAGATKEVAKKDDSALDAATLDDLRTDLALTVGDLKAILDTTPAFIAAVDPLGFITGWNTAATEITNLRREAVLHQHLVESLVEQSAQEAAADAMEAVFSLSADAPLAQEPGEPFTLVLRRPTPAEAKGRLAKGEGEGGVAQLQVRAFARRTADGSPVGLLLLQDDALPNAKHRAQTAAERQIAELQGVVALRDEELESLEAQLEAQRAELQLLYAERRPADPPASAKARGLDKPNSDSGAGAQSERIRRVSWSETNKTATFTRGSSPRSFGKSARHEELRKEAMSAS